MAIKIKDPNTGNEVIVSTKQLRDDNERWQAIQRRKANLPSRSDFPKPLPSSKTEMVVNDKYDVPGKGVMRWDGTNLVPP
jgi:hypothetical protein